MPRERQVSAAATGALIQARSIPLIPALMKSSLDYTSLGFNTVKFGERFQLVGLDYRNGTIVVNTGARFVSFTANLDIMINGVSAQTSFDFQFELINVPIYMDPNNPRADADYVKLSNSIATRTVAFNGIDFSFQLEFGETTAGGLALFDEFYVLEGMTAMT